MRFLDEDDEPTCPLCAEALDATELVLRLCAGCGYRICLFCYKRLEEAAASGSDGGARCPNCRTAYDGDRIAREVPDPAM